MHRFFLLELAPAEQDTEASLVGVRFLLPDRITHQVRDVLRLNVGEQLILLNNSDYEYICKLTKSDRMGVAVQVTGYQQVERESSVRIILYQGLLKSARFEWILEKGTELGVAAFVPTLCRRSLSGLEDAGEAKIQRWQRILQEAAEQCGRARLPELRPIQPLMNALNSIPADATALMPWEEERTRTLREGLQAVRPSMTEHGEKECTIVLFIGPEGGFTVEEVKQAQRQGVQTVTLGSRILRAETAALTTIANVMYALE